MAVRYHIREPKGWRSSGVHLQDGETIKEMSLYKGGNKDHFALGRVWFKTSMGRAYDWGFSETNWGLKNKDAGSGFAGRAGVDVDFVSPVFLKPLARAYISNAKYPTLDLSDTSFLRIETLDIGEEYWDGSNADFNFEGISQTTTWNQKLTLEFSVEVEFKGGVPFVVETGLKLPLKVGRQMDRGNRLIRGNR
ncbi:hypothetical protein BDZ45DRAFT_732682 [Acephala macrosclerotiorum]|nr:hypothetical protein BDZ45DRAFT_732682 [Acephala macrosclerotiorum]